VPGTRLAEPNGSVNRPPASPCRKGGHLKCEGESPPYGLKQTPGWHR
jgi:hypothetical protein